MKTSLLVSALLLVGCAGKRYEVCIVAEGDARCMRHDLSRPDAVHVGNALSGLGFDVVVKRKGIKLKASDLPSTTAAPEDPAQRKL